MDRQWRVYGTGPRTAKRDSIYVSLNQHGIVLLNRKAFLDLGSPVAVELLVDERNSSIGMRPADPELPHAYTIRSLHKGHTYGFTCRTFCRDQGIKIDGTASFPTARIEHGVLILELKYRVPARRHPNTPNPAAPK
ncbi:MAG: hypothetical protein IPM59_08715 [Chloracidobacterium sp.]|nr:hypothetical protein [Chloracidobacterium sp.]